jgi:hypothetical protein
MFLMILAICLCPFMKVNAQEIVNYKIVLKELPQNRLQMDFNVLNFKQVYGVQMKLKFDSKALDASEILKGNVIVDGDTNVRLISKNLDNINGRISYTITKVGQSTLNVNEGTLFSVIFNKKLLSGYDILVDSRSILCDKEGNKVTMQQTIANNSEVKIEYLSPTQQFKVNGTAKMIIRATNQTESEKQVTLIVGLYDSNDRLLNYVAINQSVLPGKSVEIEGRIKLISTGKLKCFVWDSLEDMNPLSDVLEYDVLK